MDIESRSRQPVAEVRSVLWAMASVLQQVGREARPARATLFEVSRLCALGLRIADDCLDDEDGVSR